MPPLDASTFDAPPPSTIQPNPDYVPRYQLQPATWVYDVDQAGAGAGSSRATYVGEVFVGSTAPGNQIATKADIAAATTGVSSFNARTGVVVLTAGDVSGVGGALQASPTFSGVPNAPTAAPGNNTTQLATCMFVTAAIGQVTGAMVASFNGRIGAVSLSASDITTAGGALTASPAFTGTPTTPTASVGTANSQIASTMFVSNALANGAVISWNGRIGAVTLTIGDITSAGGAPLLSPVFTGTPSGTTAAPGTASTQLATTAFVTNAISGATTGVSSFNTRTGAVVLSTADVTGAGGAPILSPALTGTPTAPTPTAGDATTKLATTQFVGTAIAAAAPGVTSFNGRTGAVTMQLADVTSVGGAPLAAPTFTGLTKAPTPTAGDNSTLVATTAFVQTALPVAASTLPIMNGAVAVGTGTTWARADHVHASDTSRLSLGGGTLTGPLTLAGNAAAALQAVPLQQLNSVAAGYLPLSGGIVSGQLGSSLGGTAITAPNGDIVTGSTRIMQTGGLVLQGSAGIQMQAYSPHSMALVWSTATSQVYVYVDSGFIGSLTPTPSDPRLKINIASPDVDALATLEQMTLHQFDLQLPGAETSRHFTLGFMADQVAALIPEAVLPGPDPDGFLAVDLLPVCGYLVGAVQQLLARVQTLEARIAR